MQLDMQRCIRTADFDAQQTSAFHRAIIVYFCKRFTSTVWLVAKGIIVNLPETVQCAGLLLCIVHCIRSNYISLYTRNIGISKTVNPTNICVFLKDLKSFVIY